MSAYIIAAHWAVNTLEIFLETIQCSWIHPLVFLLVLLWSGLFSLDEQLVRSLSTPSEKKKMKRVVWWVNDCQLKRVGLFCKFWKALDTVSLFQLCRSSSIITITHAEVDYLLIHKCSRGRIWGNRQNKGLGIHKVMRNSLFSVFTCLCAAIWYHKLDDICSNMLRS